MNLATRSSLILAALCVALLPRPGSAWAAGARAVLPPDVAAVQDRYLGCDHWSGESAYDAGRGADIDKALRELKCDRLSRDIVRLRRKYAERPAVLKVLDDLGDTAL